MTMAGNGSRFNELGYTVPKPMIPVNGVPMFVHSERCIGLEFDERIFIVQKAHNLREDILEWYPDATVVEINDLTDGTACTIMLAREHFEEEGCSIFISNCDQHTEWNLRLMHSVINDEKIVGALSVFHCPEKDPRWSYAALNEDNGVLAVAEKLAISEWATTGWYYWKDSKQFIESVEQMIEIGDRTNGEFYTCPVFNYTIAMLHNSYIAAIPVTSMIGLGTPEDLENFLNK